MPDPADNADNTIEQNLQDALARVKQPAQELPRGHCNWCQEPLEDPRGLFCPAEPGQRESDCLKSYNKQAMQRRAMGR